MSWSIKASESSHDLGPALQEADGDHVVMFCSSTDEGATSNDSTYPGLVKSCIKIGASTDTGARLSWVSSESDFLLPGDASQAAREPGVSGVSGRTLNAQAGLFGSSVSTALAAGLAGVLLYCDRLLGTPESVLSANSLQGGGRVSIDSLKTPSAMWKAFKNLSVKSQDFLQVWDHFPRGNLVWNSASDGPGTETTKDKLRAFMDNIKK